MKLTAADERQLRAWWDAILERPHVPPAGIVPVHARLVRWVGSGTLPDAGPVFLKTMPFPRGRDRWRYRFRRLPAFHEADLLAHLRAHGVPCPVVVAACGKRRRGRPFASCLVTRALPVAAAPPPPHAVAQLLIALWRARVFHPDLHKGNFLTLADGTHAVLDLQSARRWPRALPPAQKLRSLAKLLSDPPGDGDAILDDLIAAGAVPAERRAALHAAAAAVRRRHVRARILRCLRTSTEFVARGTWRGTRFERRGAPAGGVWVYGGSELVRYWIGDRTLEVLDGRQPQLGALFRKSWWLPGRHSLYIPGSGAAEFLTVSAPGLLEGFRRFQQLRNGGSGQASQGPRTT
jgi:hypothetical protein